MKLYTHYKKILADTFTPVNIYYKLRDKFPGTILLESSDYHGNENSFSYICCQPIATFQAKDYSITIRVKNKDLKKKKAANGPEVMQEFNNFITQFKHEELPFKFAYNGLFGHISYDAVKYFDSVEIKSKSNDVIIPDINYSLYEYVIAINHFNNEMYIFHHSFEESNEVVLQKIEELLNNKNINTHGFQMDGEETSDLTNEEYIAIVEKAKQHCKRGDVFQMVLSRRFAQKFKGDEFNAYRALRSINPSPYLFYFDFGNYKLFGSSPEAQLTVKNNIASIYPIAGTFKRSGNDSEDKILATNLMNDPKETAEHNMLVDLARNDLSKYAGNVEVEVYKEVQYYSHVIHLVSKVSGNLKDKTYMLGTVAATFPAGTLSGAPKHKAMQLIETYEKSNRGYYGGCIGFIGFNGIFNHAITIRTFLSYNNTLFYRAGAGVVVNSNSESELNEVNNKLMALKQAIQTATQIN